jgi:hypothetical protein
VEFAVGEDRGLRVALLGGILHLGIGRLDLDLLTTGGAPCDERGRCGLENAPCLVDCLENAGHLRLAVHQPAQDVAIEGIPLCPFRDHSATTGRRLQHPMADQGGNGLTHRGTANLVRLHQLDFRRYRLTGLEVPGGNI